MERVDQYFNHIESLLRQDHESYRVVISGCLSTSHCKNLLPVGSERLGKRGLADRVSYNWITTRVPVGTSFNHSVLQAVKEFGPAEGYVYVDSGVDCGFAGMLSKMDDRRRLGHAMVHALVDNDHGFEWLGVRLADDGSDYVVPIGKTCNLHMQMFSHELLEAYGKLMPDIFASDTSESIFTFMCAAIQRRMLILNGPCIHHEPMLDGASSGFQRGQVPFKISVESFRQRIEEGYHVGGGYEECQGVMMHDPAKYTPDGWLVSEDLRQGLLKWVRERMFLQPGEFDYKDIDHQWIP